MIKKIAALFLILIPVLVLAQVSMTFKADNIQGNGSGVTNVTAVDLYQVWAGGASISTLTHNGFNLTDADGSSLGITGAGMVTHISSLSALPFLSESDTNNNTLATWDQFGNITASNITASAGGRLVGNATLGFIQVPAGGANFLQATQGGAGSSVLNFRMNAAPSGNTNLHVTVVGADYMLTDTGRLQAISFAGDGSGITGLNAGNIASGTIPQSALNPVSSTNAAWYVQPYGNEPSAYSGGQNIYAKQYPHSGASYTQSSPIYGGSAEALKGLNGSAGMNGEIRSNKRMPWFFINADTNTVGNLGTLTNWNEAYTYTICSNYANSSFYAAITNAGGIPAYWFDSCWAAPHRTNGSFVMTVPRFPDTRKTINTYIHTNYGLQVAYCYYYFPSPPTVYNTNNTEFDRAEYAGLQGYVGWPAGGSPDGDTMPGTATTFPVMTSDTVERDISDLYNDSGDAVMMQDATQFRQTEGYEASRRRSIADAILSPHGRTPFIQGFTNQITFFNFESATPSIRLYKSNLPFVNSVTGDNGFNLLNTTPGQLVGIPDGYIRYAESSYGAMLPSDHMYLDDLCEGANFVGGSTYSQAQIKSYISQVAMAHCDFTLSSNGRMDFGTADTNTFQVITNNGCLAVWCDKAQNWAKLIQNNGTNGCIRSEQLSDGSYVLNFINTSNGIQTFSINLTNAMGLDSYKLFAQYEVWTNIFIQNMSGSGTMSVTVPADDTRWYRLYPIGSTLTAATNISVWTPYNLCYKNATAFCDSQPLGGSTNAFIERAYFIAAGSTYLEPSVQLIGDTFGSFTNFQIVTYLFTTNSGTLNYWNYDFEAGLSDSTYILTQGNMASPAFPSGYFSFTNTFQTPPGKTVKMINANGGCTSQPYATNIWFIGYRVTGY